MLKLRAIDLYCGVGGWSLGLEQSGVRVVEGIDISQSALETYRNNLGDKIRNVDLRTIDLSTLPSNLNIVVGSPPCTQFSYSNRGGSGNISDGIEDLRSFLKVVQFLEPKYWVMENVPRVAKIVEAEVRKGGALKEFRHLIESLLVVDFSELGLPQRRKRCLLGKFPKELLLEYKSRIPNRTLRDVIESFGPLYYEDFISGSKIPLTQLSDHLIENPLTKEEARLNREAKANHPVYNRMQFPDSWDRPSRTITATCTKVSRESIIIEDNRQLGDVRRLTIRERAVLQGFPGKFGFFAPSYGQKIKMVGNAFPPLISYYIGCALRGVSASRLKHPWQRVQIPLSHKSPTTTVPVAINHKYNPQRRFCVAIPGLRFDSGMRFQMTNSFERDCPRWKIEFCYGSPQKLLVNRLDVNSMSLLEDDSFVKLELKKLDSVSNSLESRLKSTDPHWFLQQVWVHQRRGLGPFELVDQLGIYGENVERRIRHLDKEKMSQKLVCILNRSLSAGESLLGLNKIVNLWSKIYAGMIVGSWFNNVLMTRCELNAHICSELEVSKSEEISLT